MVEFDRSAFIGKFQEEATEYLQRLNEGVITLEGDPGNRELIDQMLRDAHTLKGSSRMVGLIEISDVAHKLEDIMVKVRDKDLAYTADMSDSFFEALDMIVFLSENAGKPAAAEVDISDLAARLSAVAEGGAPVTEGGVSVAQTPTSDAGAAPDVPAPAGEDARTTEPDADEESEHEAGMHDRSASAGPLKAVRDDKLQSKVQHTVRIKTSQVDHLLNLVSEVVIGQIKAEQRVKDMRRELLLINDLAQSWARMKARYASALLANGDQLGEDAEFVDEQVADLRRLVLATTKDYVDDTARASTVVTDLQEHSMSLRMLPVSTVFNSFPRAMRDLARQFNKDVELVIEGGDTELDKKVLEEINDPLIHILRNAVDHGLESTEDRVRSGKPAAGTIHLAARQEGDHIVIEVSDDGAGIDPEKVKAAAVRKGYISASEAKAMGDREAQYMIFEAGFSTSAIITEISGRGVGMDVVREFVVEKLKGSLDLVSTIGEGTTFRLTIPLTLAIIRALMLRVGDRMFALPTASIEETLRVSPSEIIKVEGREVIRRQRRTIPLVPLREVLGIEGSPATGGKIPIATVGFSGHRLGFIVDSLVGEQQIVIKTLGSHLHHVDNVAGVTVLGAGQVVPILNVPELMYNGRRATGMRVRQAGGTKQHQTTGPKKILICEDSFTTRELERSIFEAAGYEVETAVDGALGLGRLREGLKVDAVVTDVQMPNMTGFQLTKAIKSDDLLKQIPVVIVTSLERDEEKAEGIDAGADAYITKSVFNQDTLLETVERLIR
ncbi:MAG: hybrid sensor histidine kinase/response regulator [Coriobacteriia bacterium]|nr:hybrid sensor histidine kinase/response regulator [Coriobacteriia bacterium]